MALFDNLSVEQLSKILNMSRWGLAIFGVFTVSVGVLNQYISDKITTKQKAEKVEATKRQKEAEQTLLETRAEAAAAKKLADDLEAKQRPRILPAKLVANITALAAQTEEKNSLQITCIIDDPEAWALAEQIKAAYEAGGFTFERIIPTMTTPPIVGIKVSTRDLAPGPLQTSIAAILTHFDKPLNADPAPETMIAKWSIRIGRKP